MRVGILALQGDFERHAEKFSLHDCSILLIKKPEALAAIDALVIPGGESTTLLKLLDTNFRSLLTQSICSGLPTLATCAGIVLLAQTVENPEQESLNVLDIHVVRNAYGSQINSFISTDLIWKCTEARAPQEGVFIRAPQIVNSGSTDVLLELEKKPVCIQQDKIVGATFHPELSYGPSPLIDYFLTSVV